MIVHHTKKKKICLHDRGLDRRGETETHKIEELIPVHSRQSQQKKLE